MVWFSGPSISYPTPVARHDAPAERSIPPRRSSAGAAPPVPNMIKAMVRDAMREPFPESEGDTTQGAFITYKSAAGVITYLPPTTTPRSPQAIKSNTRDSQ